MDTLKSNKMGKMRNMVCPYCDSGKKFKKCDCYQQMRDVFLLEQRVDVEVMESIKEQVKKTVNIKKDNDKCSLL